MYFAFAYLCKIFVCLDFVKLLLTNHIAIFVELFCILCFQEDGVVVTPVVVLFVVLVTYHTNFGQNFSMF